MDLSVDTMVVKVIINLVVGEIMAVPFARTVFNPHMLKKKLTNLGSVLTPLFWKKKCHFKKSLLDDVLLRNADRFLINQWLITLICLGSTWTPQKRMRVKNLDRLAYHSCPKSVYSEAKFHHSFYLWYFNHIMNVKLYFCVCWEIVVGSSDKPICPGPWSKI